MESTSAPHKVFVVEDARRSARGSIELLDEIDDVCVVGRSGVPAEAVAGIFKTRRTASSSTSG
jgi:hypothetical protein